MISFIKTKRRAIMKKRILCLFLALMLTLVCIPASAQSNFYKNTGAKESIQLANGDYIVVEKSIVTAFDDFDNDSSASGGLGGSSYEEGIQKICAVTESYYSADNVLVWRYQLKATYTIKYGISATCKSVSYKYKIYNDEWSFSDGNAYVNDNRAYGTGNFTRKFLFITTETRDIKLSIECDEYGNY